MRRTSKLVVIVVLIVALSSVLVTALMADDSGPIGITDTPTPTTTPAPGEGVVPEASTLVLLGTSVTGLAAYVGLQIRARRSGS